MKIAETFYSSFKNLTTPEAKLELAKEIQTQGYALINEWIKRLDKDLQQADESQFQEMEGNIKSAEEILPNPEKYSPLWENVWKDFQVILEIKQNVFKEIPQEERNGEWQILFDNPFSTEGTVVHVKLTFPAAAYQFAKYRKDLHKYEYVSLQKAHRYITEHGEQNSTLGD